MSSKSEAKQKKIEEFRQWLIDNDAEFLEHANGHFQVFIMGERLMDVWATTEKCRLVTDDNLVGMHSIKSNILAFMDK